MKNRAADWLKQAQNDYLWAQDTLRCQRFAQCCFICQQIAEKALKATAYYTGYDLVKSHSLAEISKSLGINGSIEMMAKRLDFYYISSRYPDAFPSGAPFEFFSEDQAQEALGFAVKFLEFAERRFAGHED